MDGTSERTSEELASIPPAVMDKSDFYHSREASGISYTSSSRDGVGYGMANDQERRTLDFLKKYRKIKRKKLSFSQQWTQGQKALLSYLL